MGPLTLRKLRGYLGNWHIYLLPAIYVVWNNSGGASNIMSLWLKSQNTKAHVKYTVPQINHLSMPVWAMWAVGGIIAGWMSDGPLRGRRWPMIIVFTLFNAVICIVLLVMPVYHNIPAHFVLYYLTGLTSGLSGLYFAWANEICSHDNEERALVVVLMNDLAYVLQAIVPNFVWKTVDYPKATKGLSYSIGLNLLITPLALIIRHLHQRDSRLAAARLAAAGYEDESVAGRRSPASLEDKEAENSYSVGKLEDRITAHTLAA